MSVAYVINYQAYLAFFCIFVSLVLPAAIVGMLVGPLVASALGLSSFRYHVYLSII